MGAFSGLMAILALFLADRFGVEKHSIWIFYTYVGVISVVTRAGILGRMVDRYGEAQLSRIGLALRRCRWRAATSCSPSRWR